MFILNNLGDGKKIAVSHKIGSFRYEAEGYINLLIPAELVSAVDGNFKITSRGVAVRGDATVYLKDGGVVDISIKFDGTSTKVAIERYNNESPGYE